jgi:hypothetical protein
MLVTYTKLGNYTSYSGSGKPKRTWRRTVEEIGKVGKTWKEVGALAQKRLYWRCFVEAQRS